MEGSLRSGPQDLRRRPVATIDHLKGGDGSGSDVVLEPPSASGESESESGVNLQWEAWWRSPSDLSKNGQGGQGGSGGGGAQRVRRESSDDAASDGGLSTLTLPTGDDLYHIPHPPPLLMASSSMGGEMGNPSSPRTFREMFRKSIGGGATTASEGGGSRFRRSIVGGLSRSGSGAVRESIPGLPRSQFQMYYMPDALQVLWIC